MAFSGSLPALDDERKKSKWDSPAKIGTPNNAAIETFDLEEFMEDIDSDSLRAN